MRYSTILLASLFALTACSDATPPTTSAPSPSESPRAPLHVDWVQKSKRGSELALTGRIERRAPIRVPLAIRVTVPAGVSVLSGPTELTLPPSEDTGVFDFDLVLQVSATPSDDLLLEASAAGPGFGMHGKAAYSFDHKLRAAVSSSASASGPEVKIGGRSLGRAVPLKRH